MDIETRNKIIDQYLDGAEAQFDDILKAGERKRQRIIVRLVALAAACIALILWLAPAHQSTDNTLTPIQIADGIQQMMLLDIGDIDYIEAIPTDSYAILTARLKDGSTCTYVLRCDNPDGTTTLLAYTND